MEEAASKRLLDKNVKEDNGSRETVKEWEMSPASVSLTPFFFFLCVCFMLSLETNLVFEWHKRLTGSFTPCGLFSQINSSICLLRGKIYDAMDNRPLATSSYKEALKLDVYCFEAFDLLTSHHMLTAQEGERNYSYVHAMFEILESLFVSKVT